MPHCLTFAHRNSEFRDTWVKKRWFISNETIRAVCGHTNTVMRLIPQIRVELCFKRLNIALCSVRIAMQMILHV